MDVYKNLTIAGFYHVLPLIGYNALYTPDQTYVQFHGGEIIYGQINDSDNYSIYECDFVFHGISHDLSDFNQNITQFFDSQFPFLDIKYRYSEILNRYWNYWVGFNYIRDGISDPTIFSSHFHPDFGDLYFFVI